MAFIGELCFFSSGCGGYEPEDEKVTGEMLPELMCHERQTLESTYFGYSFDLFQQKKEEWEEDWDLSKQAFGLELDYSGRCVFDAMSEVENDGTLELLFRCEVDEPNNASVSNLRVYLDGLLRERWPLILGQTIVVDLSWLSEATDRYESNSIAIFEQQPLLPLYFATEGNSLYYPKETETSFALKDSSSSCNPVAGFFDPCLAERRRIDILKNGKIVASILDGSEGEFTIGSIVYDYQVQHALQPDLHGSIPCIYHPGIFELVWIARK